MPLVAVTIFIESAKAGPGPAGGSTNVPVPRPSEAVTAVNSKPHFGLLGPVVSASEYVRRRRSG